MIARRRVLIVFVIAAILVGGSFLLTRSTGVGAGAAEAPFESLRTVLDVISLVKLEYVEPTSARDLLEAYVEKGTINGMLQAVLDDRYTRYMDPAAYEQMQIDTKGSFAGIGIMVGIRDDRVTVIAPIENTPAYKQGLKGGDIIKAIDHRDATLMSLDEAVSLMRGEPGSPVTLTVERGTDPVQEKKFTITRAVIEVPSVPQSVVLDTKDWPTPVPVGYIRLSQFSERTSEELENALRDLESKEVQGLILDLRSNPGGLLTSAIEVSDKFLRDGPIVHIVGRDESQKQTYNAKAFGTHPAKPMVVLVNEWSASSSEIVSGALQDRGVAKLVGTTTFGKGLVQSVIPLRDGSGLSLTSARYQTAGGRFIHEKGIEPDVKAELKELDEDVELEGDGPFLEDSQLMKGLEVLDDMIEQGGASLKKAS